LAVPEAVVARQVLADDLGLRAELDVQIAAAEAQIAKLLPETPFAVLPTVPGWGTIRAGNYGAAIGDPRRWPGASQIYRASGLSPAQYESAGKRRDGSISREGSVQLQGALIDLGIGLWGRSGSPPLRPTAAGPRQEGRDNRLRDGEPRQQNRLRHGSGPDRLRTPLSTRN
jgi:transposase